MESCFQNLAGIKSTGYIIVGQLAFKIIVRGEAYVQNFLPAGVYVRLWQIPINRKYVSKKKNPSVAQSVRDMVPLYLSEGEAEGVRGDIAFAQSCLVTGNFGFSGSAVMLEQNNFCGWA